MKKIKDLTIREISEICKHGICKECPLFGFDEYEPICAVSFDLFTRHSVLESIFEKEVEIPRRIKMKKIRDITIAEIKRICNGHICHKCPLFKRDEELKEDGACLLDVPECAPDWMLDKEVEVLDELFGNPEQVEEKE